VNRPLLRACGTEAIASKISAFTNTHAGVANQQKSIGSYIIAAQQFLLKDMILLCS
jgi:hypothetical protein